MDYLLSFIAFFVLLSLTILVFYDTLEGATGRRIRLFELRTQQAKTEVEMHLKDYVQMLRGIKGAMYVKDTLTRADWKNYFKHIQVEENYPGLQGVGYAIYISSEDEKKQIEEEIKKEGYPWFKVKPEGSRDAYTPIIYLEPFDWRNKRAFGYDMFSEPERRKTMEMAQDRGSASLSSKVILVQETKDEVQPGFLIYVPIYSQPLTENTLEFRRKFLRGFIYSPFRAKDFFNSIFQNEYDDLTIQVFDDQLFSLHSLLHSKGVQINERDHNAEFIKQDSIYFAGHSWYFVFKSSPGFGSLPDRIQPFLILIGGGIISILLFFVFWSFARTRRVNRVLETVAFNATAALFLIDQKGFCTFMNPAAAELTGYSYEEFKRLLLFERIIISPDSTNYPLTSLIVREEQDVRGLEGLMIQKDGTQVEVSIASKQILHNESLVAIVVEIRNISEEKEAARRIKAINEDLSNKNEQLVRINNDLDNFIYTASHDLKAPVSNIEGLVNALEEETRTRPSDPEVLIDIMGLIKKSIFRFKSTIKDLTDITRLQRNFEKKSDKVDVHQVLEEVLDSIAPSVKSTNAEIIYNIKQDVIYFSKPNLKSIIYNLLSNAIKYRHPSRKPVIQFTIQSSGKAVVIKVQDNGLGIKKENQDNVFKMFKRYHSHVEGTGIGLYIVKRMVENVGGQITVESKEGVGSTFTLLLPNEKLHTAVRKQEV